MSTNRIIQADQIEGLVFERNVIKNAIAEKNVNLWNGYDDGASSRPVDGTGGTPTGLTFSLETSTPLDGSASFKISKDAVDRQGKGYAIDFTIPNMYKFKPAQIKFTYRVAGTYSGGDMVTDSDLIVYLYRVTSTAHLIEPVPIKLDGAVPGQIYDAQIDFQFEDGVDYRLMFHVATTSASAWDFIFDNISVSCTKAVVGAVATPWQAYTPTGTWTTNTSYEGFWRRVGDSMEIDVQVNLTGAPDAVALNVEIPAGYTVDFTKLPSFGLGAFSSLGTAQIVSGSGSSFGGWAHITTPTSFGVVAIPTSSAAQHGAAPVTDTNPAVFANADYVSILVKVPIVGFGSMATIGIDADTRVVAARVVSAPTSSISGTPTLVEYGAKTYDTHGAMAADSSYTVPIAGIYPVSACVTIDGTEALDNVVQISIYKNGSPYSTKDARVVAGISETQVDIQDNVDCVSGDVIQIFASTNITGPSFTGNNWFVISRLSGPSQIHVSEKIIAWYKTATAGSVGTNTFIVNDYDIKIVDTHNAVTTGASWKFTAPRTGYYRVQASTLWDPNATGYRELDVFKNGLTNFPLDQRQAVTQGGAGTMGIGSAFIYLLAGEYIDFQLVQTSGGSLGFNASADFNYCQIESINGI